MNLNSQTLNQFFTPLYQEDGLSQSFTYINSLPSDLVKCHLKIKSDLKLAGLSFFFESFNFLMNEKISYQEFLSYEGKNLKKGTEIIFDLPFNIALTGERIGLNLLQKASSIATFTSEFVKKADKLGIKILDTRKTTPGLRLLEKYAVQVGGGYNHRLNQVQAFMIKDNHKTFFGGLEQAVDFFKNQNAFYTPLIIEIHSLEELKQAASLNLKNIMLDNFSPDDIKEAIKIKGDMSFEVSGGINIDNIDRYLIKGVDAISIGALTYAAPIVDLSLKFKRIVF